MKRSVAVLLTLPILFAAAVPSAQANDRRLAFVLGLTFAKADYIAHRLSPTHPASLAKFGARLARLSRREARVLSHVSPSSHNGAVARHVAIKSLRQLRVAGRMYVLTVNAKTKRLAARYAFNATARLNKGLFFLVAAVKQLRGETG